MAKILRTEQLSVNGDNIRLTADDGNLIINSVSGDDITQITSTVKIGQDISSLAVRDTGFDTDVSSLAVKNSEAEALAVTASKYGAYGLETSNLSTGSGSSVQTITLSGRAFISKPIVTANLTGTSNDPIIAVMVSDVSETTTSGVYQATFQFSDELPATGETDQATNYKLNIVACVSGTDADLDTIIDDMDSDRDGDGVANSLDYDPDDSSIGSAPGDLAAISIVMPSHGLTSGVISDNATNETFIDFIKAIDGTWYSSASAAGLDYDADGHDIYLFDDSFVLTFKLYSSNGSTYEKDVYTTGYSTWTNGNYAYPLFRFLWTDSNGDIESTSTGAGKYLQIKST
jgi:hypothetical protein